MPPTSPIVPPVVCNRAVAVGAERWLRDLPALVAELEAEWGFVAGATYLDATEAYVAAATLADGTAAVLKLLVPREGQLARQEIEVLRRTDGDGCARLLHHDASRDALLLERLGRSLSQLGLPIERRHEILCATAARVWRPAPDTWLPSGATRGRQLIDATLALWEQLDRPCTERVIEHAVRCADRRIEAYDDERAVLVHGDVHQWNTLEAGDGFKLVDPDGLHVEAEYDLGIIMREDPLELLTGDPRDRARWLASRSGLDPRAIWEWGVIERTSNGLLCLRDGLRSAGDEMLAAADRLAAFEW